ncbi:MAG: thiamine-phosphate kinase [Casimicrobiaceae bacterium]|nr:thiamine-phosphate kinase [Casimicrobiaceae bacterium]MDW8312612.1 thiamine-phosphate kinase [Burkholderiales bacterium]
MTEFELISRYFLKPASSALLGSGDDAAIVAPRPGHAFVVTTDSLIEGRHFLPGLAPERLAERLVAVNLSDLAAMGARPRYALLSLTLPQAEEAWVAPFSAALYAALAAHEVELIGGNTTRGELSVSLVAIGEVPLRAGRPDALLRSGAKPGDELWVSGPLGAAGWACLSLTGRIAESASMVEIERYERPVARVALGLALRGVASAAIDISDGLVSEAKHLAQASGVDIEIDAARIPTELSARLADPKQAPIAWHCVLATGDAYELLFTAPRGARARVEALLAKHSPAGARIGRVLAPRAAQPSVRVLDASAREFAGVWMGWDHFAPQAREPLSGASPR